MADGPSRAGGRLVAAFDFDGTITRRDTLVPFLRQVAGHRGFGAAFVAALPALRAAERREAYKAAVLHRILGGLRAADLHAEARAYGSDLSSQFRPEIVDRIRWHQDEGHEVVIVSASLRAYLDPVVEHLGLDGVCAVELEVDDEGLLTGHMVGANCRGPREGPSAHGLARRRDAGPAVGLRELLRRPGTAGRRPGAHLDRPAGLSATSGASGCRRRCGWSRALR